MKKLNLWTEPTNEQMGVWEWGNRVYVGDPTKWGMYRHPGPQKPSEEKQEIIINPPDEKLLFNDVEAAKLLGCTANAAHALMRSGELHYPVIGNEWLPSRNAIRAFIRKRDAEL